MTIWHDTLEERLQEVEREIKKREPTVEEWRQFKEEQELLKRLVELLNGGDPTMQGANPMPPKQNWKRICDDHGWRVGGNSAHRVVMRMDPVLHESISHYCSYDTRWYP